MSRPRKLHQDDPPGDATVWAGLGAGGGAGYLAAQQLGLDEEETAAVTWAGSLGTSTLARRRQVRASSLAMDIAASRDTL